MAEILEVTCGPLVAGGNCIVKREGEKTLFVSGAIPDERVRCQIVEDKKDFATAEVIEVLEASPFRVEPTALLPTSAGGAEWQHIAGAAQREFKMQIVRDCLTRIAKLPDPLLIEGKSVTPNGYRTTMRFAIVDGKVAMRKPASNDLVPITQCEIAHPRLRELLNCNFGDATEVTLRVSDTGIERVAWLKDATTDASLPDDVQVTHNGRNATIHETVANREWQISAQSFFQSGPQAAVHLADAVNRAVDDDAGWVVDLYSGIGLLGGVVCAERSSQLTCVEQSKSSARDARHNLSDLAAEIIEAEVAEVALAGNSTPDVVIADPPRPGLGKSAAKATIGIGAQSIVLISCDPASLARDVNLLHEGGYELQQCEVLDLFPQTSQVETVSVFNKFSDS